MSTSEKPSLARSLGEIPQFKRGTVWCCTCGRQRRIDAVAASLHGGWPKCCGYTMTIDSPEERAALAAKAAKL